MTTVQDKAHDPRTYKEPPVGKAYVPPARQVIGCAGPDCPVRVDVTGLSEDKMLAQLLTHGWCDGAVGEERKPFCSKRCRELQARIQAADAIQSQKAEQNIAEYVAAPTSVKSHIESRDGHDATWITCSFWTCPTKLEVGPGHSTPAEVVRYATVSGWVQTKIGTFCSFDCAKKARSAAAAGAQDAAPKDPRFVPPLPVQAEAPKPIPDSDPYAVRDVPPVTKSHPGIHPHPQNQRAKEGQRR